MKTTNACFITGLLLEAVLGAFGETLSFTKITTGPPATDLGTTWGGSWGDDDGDGYVDLFVARHGTGVSAIYRNHRDGTFTIITNSPFANTADVWACGAWADLDNDSRLDLFALRNAKPAFMYFNNGDGTFTSSQFQSLTPYGIAIGDYNRDGLLDLFIPSYPAGLATLYRNNGGRTFTRVTSTEAGPLVSTTTFGGAEWADYDDDGRLELHTSDYGSGRNLLFHNDGTGRFVEVTNLVTQTRQPAVAGAWGDYDNDGRVDLCVACLNGTSTVYRNLGNGNFEKADIGLTLGGGNSAAWVDYDNDGFMDLFTTYPNVLYHNNGNGTFTRDTTGSIENDDKSPSYAGLWFDYDNDGFLDLYVFNGNDAGTANVANSFYHNNGNGNQWLKVRLIGTASNRDGIGAKARAQAKYAGQVRWQRRDISAGDAYNGNNLHAHFGLGDATNVTTLRIEWPSGSVQELTDVAAGQFLAIWEPPALRAEVQTDGTCLLTVTAELNRPWRIESSTGLKTWQTLTTITSPTSPFQYTHTGAKGLNCLFYRVVSP